MLVTTSVDVNIRNIYVTTGDELNGYNYMYLIKFLATPVIEMTKYYMILKRVLPALPLSQSH